MMQRLFSGQPLVHSVDQKVSDKTLGLIRNVIKFLTFEIVAHCGDLSKSVLYRVPLKEIISQQEGANVASEITQKWRESR